MIELNISTKRFQSSASVSRVRVQNGAHPSFVRLAHLPSFALESRLQERESLVCGGLVEKREAARCQYHWFTHGDMSGVSS